MGRAESSICISRTYTRDFNYGTIWRCFAYPVEQEVFGMALYGIDVSRYQGAIDWETVKNSGVQFAMLRAGYGNNNIDPTFRTNAAACNRLGIPCGAYWFSYAWSIPMARQEAIYCIEAVRPYQITYPISFDLEYDTVRYAAQNGVTISRQLATDMTRAFCDEVQAQGYRPMFYTNRDYSLNMFYMDQLKDYAIWYALYRDKLDRDDVSMWQFTESGTVPGIDGNVDLNYSFIDFSGGAVPPTGDPWVRRLQVELNRQGFGPLVVDGLAGPATHAALPILRRGDRGGLTRLVQERLNMPSREQDGIYGSNTENRVRQFQQEVGIRADGIVGPQTWGYLLYL